MSSPTKREVPRETPQRLPSAEASAHIMAPALLPAYREWVAQGRPMRARRGRAAQA